MLFERIISKTISLNGKTPISEICKVLHNIYAINECDNVIYSNEIY